MALHSSTPRQEMATKSCKVHSAHFTAARAAMRDFLQSVALAIVAALCGALLFRQFTLPQQLDPVSVLDAHQYTMPQAAAGGATGLDFELLADDDSGAARRDPVPDDDPDPRLWESSPDLLY